MSGAHNHKTEYAFTFLMQQKQTVQPAPEQAPEQAVTTSCPEKNKKKRKVQAATTALVNPSAPKKKRSCAKHVVEVINPTTQPTPTQPTPTQPVQSNQPVDVVPDAAVATHKKRGRKPKGGKVIQQLMHESASINDAPNIILHLKCSVHDLTASLTDSSVKPGDIVSFNTLETKGADLNESYHYQTETGADGAAGNFIIHYATTSRKSKTDALIATNSYNHLNHDGEYDDDDDDDDETGSNDKNLKDIWKKLNHLKLCFHKSDVFQNIGSGTRRSCCFWDTCEFDTPPIYIPRCIAANGGHSVYGCFCSPECALAYLMNEGVDTSVKFERCQILNSMYGKLLNYEKSIKPAPNPQYILNKFYGNLSIQEYRRLFKSEQIVYVVNKPLTHILPEMYEDNNDFLLNNKVIPNNTYKLKKKTSVFG